MLSLIIIVCIFKDNNSKYFKIGPNDDLILISIKIDTWNKWVLSLFLIGILKIGEVIVNEIG